METIGFNFVMGSLENDEIYVCRHAFRDTGVIFERYRPVYEKEYQDATSPDGLQTHLARWWQDSRRRGDQRTIGEFASEIYAEKGIGTIWDKVNESTSKQLDIYMDLVGKEALFYTSCGGGLCLDRGLRWGHVMRPVSLYWMLEYSDGLVTWDKFCEMCAGDDAFVCKCV